MALRFPLLILLLTLGSSSSDGLVSSSPKAISDLKEAIVKGLGFQTDGFEISGFDIRDSLVGQSVAYEFHIQVDDKVLPFKLLEDVNRWEYVDERITTQEEEEEKESSNLLMKRSSSDSDGGVLAPFQLAGPMEIWIQDAKHMRLSLPHDVDAGVLKKVILADGAVVTVKGARSVSLRQPLDLPLPLNHTHTGFASGLLTLAHRLRLLASSTSSGDTPLVSVRIVGPTSLTTTTTAPSSTNNNKNKLKLKRLAPGLVELSSPSLKTKQIIEEKEQDEEPPVSTFLAPDQDQFNKMWPFASVNGSNSNLRGFEALLYTVLGEKANNKGSFRLLKAEASAQTFLKMVFKVEKELKGKGHGHDDETVSWQGFPEWKTKPEAVKMHFEVLAKVDGDKVVAEKVVQVPDPVVIEDTVAPNLLMGNVTMSSLPLVYPPSSFFTL